MVFMWFIFFIFLVLTLILLSGKGAFLIAGYNTASKQDQNRYDEKKLCRVVGCGMAVITVLFAVWSIAGDDFPRWLGLLSLIIMLSDCVIMIILSNTKCFKDQEKTDAGTETAIEVTKEAQSEATIIEEKKKRRARLLTISGISILVVVFCFTLLLTGNISMKYGEESMKIKASWWKDYTIRYDEIESVRCESNLELGSRTGGLGSFKLNEGTFHNDSYGKYTLYAYTDCKTYVVLYTVEGTVVINGMSDEDTQKIYENMKQKVMSE